MTARRADIEKWFDEGVERDRRWLIVVRDTFDNDNFPVYCGNDENPQEMIDGYRQSKMTAVDEVYDLVLSKSEQLAEKRAWHVPGR